MAAQQPLDDSFVAQIEATSKHQKGYMQAVARHGRKRSGSTSSRESEGRSDSGSSSAADKHWNGTEYTAALRVKSGGAAPMKAVPNLPKPRQRQPLKGALSLLSRLAT
jgi:hypothetical protein